MNSTAIATIDLSALSHNIAQIQQWLPQARIMAMVKSNAYGHGLIPVVRAMSAINMFGVATIAEALQLRGAGIERDFVVMRGFTTEDELAVFFNDPHLIACIHTAEQVALLERQSRHHQTLRIWLKIDTGMHRLGFACDAFDVIYKRLNALLCVDKSFVVGSHLADADNTDTTFTQQQIALFEKTIQHISNQKSLLNSAGIVAYSQAAYDWIRPGLMLYGISPFASHHPYHNKVLQSLRPVMTLQSQLIAIKTIDAGEKIGYSCTYTAQKPMKIGVVGMGYGDSYPRHVKEGTPVLIRGMRCPIVGRVSMDMMTVDLSALSEAVIGDTVTLWGDALLVSDMAENMHTVAHELICHLTGRVQTVYTG